MAHLGADGSAAGGAPAATAATTGGNRGSPGSHRRREAPNPRHCRAPPSGASRTRTGGLLGAIQATASPEFGLFAGFSRLWRPGWEPRVSTDFRPFRLRSGQREQFFGPISALLGGTAWRRTAPRLRGATYATSRYRGGSEAKPRRCCGSRARPSACAAPVVFLVGWAGGRFSGSARPRPRRCRRRRSSPSSLVLPTSGFGQAALTKHRHRAIAATLSA
jgi:hypothetical protein